VPERLGYRVELAAPAVRDFDEIIEWTVAHFGYDAAIRYADLMAQAFEDLASDPFRIGTLVVPGAPSGLLTYHLIHGRHRSRSSLGAVKRPRHVVLYRPQGDIVYILRILHDARDLARHLPEDP
jgi:toxin ParE1/3/4